MKKSEKSLHRLSLPFDSGCLGCGCLPGSALLLRLLVVVFYKAGF
ncbi:hypothetical protein [Litchfieldia salsa]|uniref:Uncharacterized protein n=1 Tax=Litchfieldia salsa TaxID=930152 RepID=A0A1H0VCF0_9BACI|nr:hypothetical protein [Litchfieldia salsa]SDP75898.1 hypothetical protein SAMN05216565_106171 [Litchfieldia salsa]